MKRPPIHDERSLRIAACLGVDGAARTAAHAAHTQAIARHAARLDAALAPGCVALVTGPSGAGKTTLLRMLARGPGSVVVRPVSRRRKSMRVASLCTRAPVAAWAGILARFGLAEASVLLAQVGDLSAGERARLELAFASARFTTSPGPKPGAGGPRAPIPAEDVRRDVASLVDRPCAPAQGSFHTLIADEWCSLLDRRTAISVAAGAARWARQRGVRLIGATAHDDLADAGVDIVLRLDESGGARWTVCGLSVAG